MHDSLIILAGGASSRMKKPSLAKGLSEEEMQQANERSKGLIGVGPKGRPLLDYLLYNAEEAGYKNIYILIGEQGDLFKEFYGRKQKDNKFQRLNISFATQYIPKNRIKPFGTADALYQTLEQYPELKTGSFTVCNSDNLYSILALSQLRQTHWPHAFISYYRDALDFSEDRIQRFALAKLNNENALVDIIEKPPIDDVEKFRDVQGKLRVSMNVFKFNGTVIYPYLRDCPIHPDRNEKELPTALLNMMKAYPSTVLGIPLSEHVPDLTAKEDIAAVKTYLQRNFEGLNWWES